jgi:antitoxin (DNA-binding transcriptional repressor) of toxin-antitoxin stability system
MYQDTSVRGDVPRKQTTSELEVRLAGHGRPVFVIVTVETRPREVHNTEESIADCLRP